MTWLLVALVGVLFYRVSRISRRLALLEHERGFAPAPQDTVAAPAPPVTPPRPSLWARIHSVEWEAVLGGNWLNKLGVLVLVIGVALLLGYSFRSVGPAGRVATGGLIAAAMLAGGIVLEKRGRYTIFARGLIGGGWAVLYFTGYAAHAIEAARIIASPLAATLLLSALAVAMILHSLRYQSEAVTGLAYFVTFMTLAISPAASFAIVASVPLAVSLVALAYRFRWTTMLLFGVPATYLHYTWQAAHSSGGSFAAAQAIVTMYWLLFEAVDVLHARGRNEPRGASAAVFFLNAAGFVGVSWLQWSREYPDTLYLFFVAAAVVYGISAVIRGSARYQAPSALAALCAGIAICQRFTGMTLNLGLLLEGELLFLAGLFLRQPFLRYLGGAVFVALGSKIALNDAWDNARVAILGAAWRSWSPVAVFAAALFYANRALLASSSLFGYAASAITLAVLACELPNPYVGLSWLLLAAVLFEIGTRTSLSEYRVQAFGAAVLSAVPLVLINVLGFGASGRPQWLPILAAAVVFYAAAARAPRGRVRALSISAGSFFLTAFLGNVLPATWVTVAWGLQGVALLAVGFPAAERNLRLSGLLQLLLCILKLFLYDLRNLETPQRIVSFIALGLILLAVSWTYTRFRDKLSRYL